MNRARIAALLRELAEEFEKDDDVRLNLSGAACAPTTPKFASCLIANDEKKYAQFFSIVNNTITPLKLIRLSDANDDPDGPIGRGAAYWPEVARLLRESYRSLAAALA